MIKRNQAKKERTNLASLGSNRNINLIFIIFFTIILIFISILRFEDNKLKIGLNDYADRDIRATKDIVDKYATEVRRQEAYNSVEPKYRVNPSIQMGIKESISNLFDIVRDTKIKTNLSNRQKINLVRDDLDLDLNDSSITHLLNMEYKDLNSYEATLLDLTTQIMGVGIREEDLEYEKDNLDKTFESLSITESQKNIGISLLSQLLEPNKFLDQMETTRIRELAASMIEDVIVKENEIIASQGEKIDRQKLELIKESGLLKESNTLDLFPKFGIALLVILGVFSLVGYIFFYDRDIIYSNRMRVYLFINVLVVLLSRAIFSFSPNLIPVATAGMLISILINSRLAIIANIFLSLFLGMILGLDTSLITMLIIGGSLAVLVISYQKQRTNILLSGLVLAFANVIVITSFGLIKGLKGTEILIRDLQVFINGILSMVLAIGSLPLWERFFSILTPIRLLELSNPNQPLLKRLMLEAPGTYHHSLMVGNLSEAAADAIGANSLLARVGAYYHDIGKLYKPYYFKENQFGMSNPHDLLTPEESVEIILEHVSEGVELARDNKLPKEIINFIDEHHGSTLVAYFYHLAKESNGSIDIEDYRYKGNKPQSRETALVMLADSVEAAVRSLKELSQENVEEMVKKIVKGKLADGQLDECDITNKDINIIINTFINILLGIYHDRIEYPSMEPIVEEGH